jgi:hypothetical protein
MRFVAEFREKWAGTAWEHSGTRIGRMKNEWDESFRSCDSWTPGFAAFLAIPGFRDEPQNEPWIRT